MMKEKMVLSRLRTWAVSMLVLSCLALHAQTTGVTLATVADCGESGMYFATLCPDHDVTIDKNVGDAFSIYVDLGFPYFNKLRIRGGKYNVKAGESVVFKTAEASTFEVPAASGIRSSLNSNDIICPAEDTPTADFIANLPLGEGEYIYMLTNLENNGGLGFTHFKGLTMRKGCFFIVSSIKPESISVPTHTATRAATDIEDGDMVPLLPGEAGSNEGFVTLVKNGPDDSFVPGDANNDGVVNGDDVRVMSDYILEKPVSSFAREAADVNGDNAVNVADIVGIIDIINAHEVSDTM